MKRLVKSKGNARNEGSERGWYKIDGWATPKGNLTKKKEKKKKK